MIYRLSQCRFFTVKIVPRVHSIARHVVEGLGTHMRT